MKKILFTLIGCCMAVGLSAQNYIFVNSETIFKSQSDYNAAITELERIAEVYQKNIEDAYSRIEETVSNYQSQRSYLSETRRAEREQEIADMEQKVTDYQEQKFGNEGELMAKRLELIKPIQDRIFAAINRYAESNNLDMIIDVVNNQTLLYYKPALDKTNEIINLLK